MHRRLAVFAVLLLSSAPLRAQAIIPSQLSVGGGLVGDREPGQISPIVAFSLGFVDSGENTGPSPFRTAVVFAGELGATSDLDACQTGTGQAVDTPNCHDAALFMGFRFYFFRGSPPPLLPFLEILPGSYSKGSGVEDQRFAPGRFILHVGGGFELRRPRSIHGLQLSLGLRRVFAGDPSRTQIRLLVGYVLGCPCS